MEKMSCVDGHNYGLWREENGKACRTCQECLYIESLPMDEDTREQIHVQDEAKVFLKAFKLVDLNDPNIIGYLDTILDYYSFLDRDSKNILFNKMDTICKNESIGIENCAFISEISSNLKEHKMDKFDSVFYMFKSYNADMFESILEQTQVSGYHR